MEMGFDEIKFKEVIDPNESEEFKLADKGGEDCKNLSSVFFDLASLEYDYMKMYNKNKVDEGYLEDRKYLLNDIKVKIEGLMDIINELEG